MEIVIVRYKKVLSHTSDLNYSNVKFIQMYLRPVRGCTSGGCVIVPAMVAGLCCLGLLTLVLLLANSSLIVWGRSGSNRTPCCKREKPDKWWGWLCAHCGGVVKTKYCCIRLRFQTIIFYLKICLTTKYFFFLSYKAV